MNEVREISDTTILKMDWVLFFFMLPPHLRVIRYVFLLKLYFVITCRQKHTAIYLLFSRNCKSLKMINIKHSPITYTRNELLSKRASACLRPYMINCINNCAIDIYRRKRRTHRGGRRKQHKINVAATPACLTPTFIVKQHGLIFPISIFRCIDLVNPSPPHCRSPAEV